MEWKVKHYPNYIGGVKQVYPNVAEGRGIFARSVVAGNLIFISGMTGADLETGKVTSDDFKEQMLVALDKIRMAMEETGSSMNNIIKTLILLKDLNDYPSMRKTELEYYQKHAPFLIQEPPASTVFQPVSLARPEFLIEIEVVGVLSR